MSKLKPFFSLRLREDEPPGAVRNARPAPHALPLCRYGTIPSDPGVPAEATVERRPTASA